MHHKGYIQTYGVASVSIDIANHNNILNDILRNASEDDEPHHHNKHSVVHYQMHWVAEHMECLVVELA